MPLKGKQTPIKVNFEKTVLKPHQDHTTKFRDGWMPYRSVNGRKYEGLSRIGQTKEDEE